MITADDIKSLEEASGIAGIVLMERAGHGVVKELKSALTDVKNKKILIICHHGNNGGDGFVVGRLLSEEAEVNILFIGDEDKLTSDASINYNKVERNDLIQFIADYEELDFSDFDIIIDAMLGTGSKGELREPIASIVPLINSASAFTLCVDIPTGVNPDSEGQEGIYVEPDLIVTFHDVKKGLIDFGDKVKVVDIGISK